MNSSSYSNALKIKVSHINLSLHVKFSEKVLSGRCELLCEAQEDQVQEIIFDSKELNIKKVETSGSDLEFVLGAANPIFGSPLTVRLPTTLAKNERILVTIFYSTSPAATALEWLAPEQTKGKVHPFLFTQCQAIHARTLLPCQDTPSVKAPYTAELVVDKPLVALMSALSIGVQDTDSAPHSHTFRFSQPVPMPSYLIAIAVGALESREIGPRSRVWAEPQTVASAAFEFSETETFVAAGEALLGDYVWGRYDILLLPPSFPYGGMENPCLTFVTPTLLAGDRSLSNVVAHEIAHSWTGNLVSCCSWDHFWLNEGFTVFVERKIVGKIFGQEQARFQAEIGLTDLRESINHMVNSNQGCFTRLVHDLGDQDPDSAFSSVPYEKGFNFLVFLEEFVGGPLIFEPFLKAYIQKFANLSVTTSDFQNFFISAFAATLGCDKMATLDWQLWLHSEGDLPVVPDFRTSMSAACSELAAVWINAPESVTVNTMGEWRAVQKVLFLEKLMNATLTVPFLEKMDSLYALSAERNCEIRFRWCQLGIRAEYSRVLPCALGMLSEQGRMKFVRPLYRSLFKSTMGHQAALDHFAKNKNSFHPITQKMVSIDLDLAAVDGAAAASADVVSASEKVAGTDGLSGGCPGCS